MSDATLTCFHGSARVRHREDSTIGRTQYVLVCTDCDEVVGEPNEDELSDAAAAYAESRYDHYYENSDR